MHVARDAVVLDSGASALSSGLLMLPLLAASAISTIASGQIMAKTGRYKLFPILGLAAMSAGLLLFSTLDATHSRLTAALFMVIFGIGFGMVTQILMVAIQNAVQPREIGTRRPPPTCSVRSEARSASPSSVRSSPAALRHWLPVELSAGIRRGITATGIQTTPTRIHSLPPAIQHAVAHAVENSLHGVFTRRGPGRVRRLPDRAGAARTPPSRAWQ